ncbi:MAG: prefoldin subunit alpha [Nanoarchaeota archaeon]|nr:prefoldin subunit alpha [Nanoarchaeota archaeon]
MNEEKVQEKYIEMKTLEEQMKHMQEQAATLEQQLMETMTIKKSLDDFKKAQKGDEILVPISQGIFAKAELKENKEFLVNVGANTIVNKDIESTKKLMDKQIEEMQGVHSKAMMQLQQWALKAASIEKELKELSK